MSLTFPARFMLVGAMNPCPCGYYGDPHHECICTPTAIRRYRAKVSGPLLDRLDIHIEVPAVAYAELISTEAGEASKAVRDRVIAARTVQSARFAGQQDRFCNGHMSSRDIRSQCVVDGGGQKLLEIAVTRLGLSARAYDRILKVGRTISDLDGCDIIESRHIGEAIQYRSLDRSIPGA
jgi:magnesium chelatase family protein